MAKGWNLMHLSTKCLHEFTYDCKCMTFYRCLHFPMYDRQLKYHALPKRWYYHFSFWLEWFFSCFFPDCVLVVKDVAVQVFLSCAVRGRHGKLMKYCVFLTLGNNTATVKDTNLCHDWSGETSVLEEAALKIWAKSWVPKRGLQERSWNDRTRGKWLKNIRDQV